jgi:pimeloyl-ACP methyl ester carboxylesterase
MSNKVTEFEGRQIAYTVEGKGFPVLLLHGFCEDARMWDDFQQDLIEEKYRVIRVDLPGFGKSDVIPAVSISQMAAAVKQVLDELKIEKLVFVGHSMGGYVGLSFARQYPEYLIGLSLFHSHPFEDTEEKKKVRQKSVEFIERQGTVLFIKQMIPTLFTPNFVSSNAFLLEKLIFRATQYAPEGIQAAQSAMANRASESETLKNISVPVQFIIGENDTTIPEEMSKKQIHLPEVADIRILEKSAHMGMFEERKKTQRHVRHFVDFCIEKDAAS